MYASQALSAAAPLSSIVFPSRTNRANHISTRQYARLVDEWVTGIGLRSEDYETLSLRLTEACIIYKRTGNLRAVHLLLGHTKIESTVRYLGVNVEDALSSRKAQRCSTAKLLYRCVEEQSSRVAPLSVLRRYVSWAGKQTIDGPYRDVPFYSE